MSTYDPINQRYFLNTSNGTNSGIVIVNAQTGKIISTISNSINFKGLEYNINTGKLMGSHWTGKYEIFTSLDLTTKTFTDIDTLFGVKGLAQGETTFDQAGNKYLAVTNLGVIIVDASNGKILAVVDDSKNLMNMKGIEISTYNPVPDVAFKLPSSKVYPNPFNAYTTISFPTSTTNATLNIYNINGQLIKTITQVSGNNVLLDAADIPHGTYSLLVTENNQIIIREKLIVVE